MHFIQCCKFLDFNRLVSFPKNTYEHFPRDVGKYEGRYKSEKNYLT